MPDAAALAIEDVVAGYGGVPVLNGVSVAAQPGTITAVLGANGAGKTTLLRTISGLVRPRQGRILVDGTNLARRHPEDITRAGVAHVPEGQGVITELTVEENLRLGALSRRGGSVRSAALADAYRRFPLLAERRKRQAGLLSGAEVAGRGQGGLQSAGDQRGPAGDRAQGGRSAGRRLVLGARLHRAAPAQQPEAQLQPAARGQQHGLRPDHAGRPAGGVRQAATMA
jgi:ABC-type sugar transport system ATPase subunit